MPARRGAEAAGLDVAFTAPVTDHPASEAAGDHLAETPSEFWRDHQSAKVNAIRTRTLIERCDLMVVRSWCTTTDQVVETLRYVLTA